MKLLCASAALSRRRNLSPFLRFRQHRNMRTFLVTFTVVVCFAVTTLPTQIIYILTSANVIEFPGYYTWFVLLEKFGVSVVNPFIYGTLDKKLFFSLMKCLRKILYVQFCTLITMTENNDRRSLRLKLDVSKTTRLIPVYYPLHFSKIKFVILEYILLYRLDMDGYIG